MTVENRSYQLHISIVVSTFVMILIIGTFMFRYLEDWTYIQSFYFSVTTVTTVGYWDLLPTNDKTRLWLSIYILFSVTLYISTAAVLWNWYLEKFSRKRETILEKYSEVLEKYHVKRKKDK